MMQSDALILKNICKVDNRIQHKLYHTLTEEAIVLGEPAKLNKPRFTREEIREISQRCTWRCLNQPSQLALENFNHILGKAQMRAYHEIMGKQ